jgi:hypothetical protein
MVERITWLESARPTMDEEARDLPGLGGVVYTRTTQLRFRQWGRGSQNPVERVWF